MTDPLGNVTRRAFDESDRPVSRTDANGHTTRSAFDEADRLVAVTGPDAIAAGSQAATTYAYDASGLVVGRTDPLGRASTVAYDGASRPIAATDAPAPGRRRVDRRGRERPPPAARRPLLATETATTGDRTERRNATKSARQATTKARQATRTITDRGRRKPTCNSFTPDTRVVMADGSTRPIGQLRPGDTVLTTDPDTGVRRAEQVAATIVSGAGEQRLVDLTLARSTRSERPDPCAATASRCCPPTSSPPH